MIALILIWIAVWLIWNAKMAWIVILVLFILGLLSD